MRWILVLAAGGPGAAFFVANWHGLLAWLLRGRRSTQIPIIGGALLAVAMAASPSPNLRPLWWLPLVLDPGGLLLMIASLIAWTRRDAGAKDAGRRGGPS